MFLSEKKQQLVAENYDEKFFLLTNTGVHSSVKIEVLAH